MNDPIVQKPKKKPTHNYNNPYEVLSDFGKDVVSETKQHTKSAVNEIFHELFALPKKGGDLQPGQELNLKSQNEQKSPKESKMKSLENHANQIRPAIDYIGEILKTGETKQEEQHKMKEEIQQVILELKSLASSTKQLEKEIVEATGHTIINPGKYHKTFFRWLLSIVQDARVKIDNAGVWLSEMNGKQSKKGAGAGKKKQNNYWDMAKKHGHVKFTLSGERAIATQAG
jgi:myosin heavy subunit